MATAEQLKALIKSYAEGDDERFLSVALQVAAHAARSGHSQLARDLRDVIDAAKTGSRTSAQGEDCGQKPVPVVQPRGELAGILSASYPRTRLRDMVLEERLSAKLKRVLLEQLQQERLESFGLQPRRKLLLVGPPGSGKTMTAAALAGELSLPLFTVRLDGLITRYLGETAAKLRLVFDSIGRTRGVYLFDEFDALGSQRAASNDVGEIRRVLNSFLQLLEQDDSGSLLVCATNHRELLDRALFRRFDDVLEYVLPSPEVAAQVMKTRLTLFDTSDIDWQEVARAADGLSQAELVRACEDTAKAEILAGSQCISRSAFLESIAERKNARG